jgi:hypothetical protein
VLALMMMMAFVGIVVDVGYLYTQKANMQSLADAIVLSTLGTTGLVTGSPSRTTAQQIAYIDNFISTYQNPANGLPIDWWTQRLKEVNTGGDVVKLTLNQPMPLSTFVMALLGIPTVTVGIQAVAVRGCFSRRIQQDKSGRLGFFGCNEVNLQGNPTWRSRNYNTWAIGDKAYGGSNIHILDQGSVYFGGDVFSANTIEFIGGGSTWNGTYTAPNIINHAGGGSYTGIVAAVPPIETPPAVGNATAADNDNSTVGGAAPDFLAGITYVLEKANPGPQTMYINAGSRIYAHTIDLKQTTLVIMGDPRPIGDGGQGPVTFNIEPLGPKPNVNNERLFMDRDVSAAYGPMKPSYLNVIGLAQTPCSIDCDRHNKDVPKLVFSHNTIASRVYAPGFQVHIDSNPSWSGSMVADCIHTQGTPLIYIDEEGGFSMTTIIDPVNCKAWQVYLVN